MAWLPYIMVFQFLRRSLSVQFRGLFILLLFGGMAAKSLSKDPDPAEKLPAEAVAFFESKIRPVLMDNCFKCHGEKKPKANLRLDSRGAMLIGGDLGPVLVPGQPDKSMIIKAISHADPELKMPPSKKLPSQQIADLTQWVKIGAPWPGGDKTVNVVPKRGEFQITDKDRAHWAFQPVRRPPLPSVKHPGWATQAIDTFILARLESKGLQPNPAVAKQELLRRVYYDLTGLPPTPDEVEAFLTDSSSKAYEKVVESLLASPHYGEKWGRHWLDLVRYAETNSYERDNPKPNAWRFRDYVIRSFNQDKPYDQFIKEQLAGDEMAAPLSPNPSPLSGERGATSTHFEAASAVAADPIIATGFYRLGIWDDEPTDRDQARFDGLDDIITTTGQVFLGMTIDCARCHDHKIDPIPQKDYYRLLAFFNNIHHFRNGGPTDEMKLVSMLDGRAACLPLPPEQKDPKKNHPAGETALCVSEIGPRAPETFVLLRGNPQVRGDKVEPGFLQVLNVPSPMMPSPPVGAKTSGRRLVLANWLTSRDNPLPARVMANRVWQHHFGRGIVRSPNNFGTQGDRPTHPELLDWLACELVENHWSLKHLHRLILMSSTYRMSSRGNAEALARDPTNDLLWRFDMRRLSAEEIRDSILAVTGSLNRKMSGPGIYPEIPPEVLAGQSRPGYGWGQSPLVEQNRRSVYIHLKRSLMTPILESFDAPETDRTNPVRFSTTQPTQALAMLNSVFLNKQAGVLADRLTREAGLERAKQVELALRLVTGRQPLSQEIQRGVKLIDTLQARDQVTPELALRYFCLVALNLNEFVYLD